jgi:hypothetical protein
MQKTYREEIKHFFHAVNKYVRQHGEKNCKKNRHRGMERELPHHGTWRMEIQNDITVVDQKQALLQVLDFADRPVRPVPVKAYHGEPLVGNAMCINGVTH